MSLQQLTRQVSFTRGEIECLATYATCWVGLIITGANGIQVDSLSHAGPSLLTNDKQIAGFSKLTPGSP